MRKTIKKIAALGTGAVMLGASIGFASAQADLAQYPNQYIQDGKFTGVMVVGDKAAADDVIGVSDIAISLQAAAVKKVGTGTAASVSVSGEAWQVGTSTKILEISENLNTGSNREAIANITNQQFIDDQELPSLLASGALSNSKGSADFDQRLYFEDSASGYILYTEDDDQVTADFLFFPNGRQIARYELEFTTNLESDVENAAGTSSSTGLFLGDIEDVEVNLLGKPYTIVTAKRTSSRGHNVELTLMGGSNRDTLLEGETKTYNIAGKEMEVTLNFVDSDEAQFTVNGETTRKISDGDTDVLSDGTTLGVSDILYQDYAGGVHSATFFIGADKIELKDTQISDSSSSNTLEVNEESIDDADVIIEGTDDNSTFKIEKIIVNISAEDDLYVPAGGRLSENPELEEPEALFTQSWDILYEGLSIPMEDQNMIKIRGQGSDEYELSFHDGNGDMATIPIANAPGANNLRYGDDDDDLVTEENQSITKQDYFIVTDETDDNGERVSFALRYENSNAVTDDDPTIDFENLGSGERIERPISPSTAPLSNTVGPSGTPLFEIAQIKLGGSTWAVYNTSSARSDDFDITVDLDSSGSITNGERISINTKCGAEIEIYNTTMSVTQHNITGVTENITTSPNDGILINITTPDTDHFDDLTPTPIRFNITADSAGEVRMNKFSGQNLNYRQPEDEDDTEYAYTSMGAFVKYDSPTSDPQEVEVYYPCEQNVPLVYIVGDDASVSTVEDVGEDDVVLVSKIDVGATKLASEVADILAVNSILVGGPCANAAAATVMGNPSDCAAGFKPGVGRVQMWDVGTSNVAMLVAGYSAIDTRNAAQVVAKYREYSSQLSGDHVEVTKVNNQLTVAEPAPEPVVEETTEEEETSEDEETEDTESEE